MLASAKGIALASAKGLALASAKGIYDPVHEGMSQNKRCVTDPAKISFWGAGDYSEMVAGARLRLHTALVDIDVVENPEDELPTRKSLRE